MQLTTTKICPIEIIWRKNTKDAKSTTLVEKWISYWTIGL